jgi:hypothetical protein
MNKQAAITQQLAYQLEGSRQEVLETWEKVHLKYCPRCTVAALWKLFQPNPNGLHVCAHCEHSFYLTESTESANLTWARAGALATADKNVRER